MSVILLAENRLEDAGATLTVTSALAANPQTRLYDRDRGLQCIATGAGQWDVDLTLAGDASAGAVALVNHNIAGSLEVYADTASPIGTTLIATLAPAGIDPFYGAFALTAKTKWRLRFAAFGAAPALGEILLGVPTVLGNPSIYAVEDVAVGNVARDESPGGYVWKTQLGVKRARLIYGWALMTEADWTALLAAYDQTSQGAKSLLAVDVNGTARWVEFLQAELRGKHVPPASRQTQVQLLEAL